MIAGIDENKVLRSHSSNQTHSHNGLQLKISERGNSASGGPIIPAVYSDREHEQEEFESMVDMVVGTPKDRVSFTITRAPFSLKTYPYSMLSSHFNISTYILQDVVSLYLEFIMYRFVLASMVSIFNLSHITSYYYLKLLCFSPDV